MAGQGTTYRSCGVQPSLCQLSDGVVDELLGLVPPLARVWTIAVATVESDLADMDHPDLGTTELSELLCSTQSLHRLGRAVDGDQHFLEHLSTHLCEERA